jgi:uncharacterized protein (TIGR03032 family)
MSSPASDPSPFQLSCTPALPELLTKLECTIALTTYQAGKLVFVSPQSEEQLVQLLRSFERPMALRWNDGVLMLSTNSTVEFFADDIRMASNYPRQSDTYDHLYLPRRTVQTGRLDIHGLGWDQDGSVWIINTRFSCLAKLSDRFCFESVWSPPFIADLVPEDRCHVNGVAFRDGKPIYATCLSATDEQEGWRKALPDNGVLVDVESNEVIIDGLAMPHTPLFVGDTLYMLLSATGELVRVEPDSGRYSVVEKVGGFVRGMAYHRSHLFIAHSKLRRNSSTFRDLPIANEATEAGVAVIHEPTGTLVGRLTYRQSVDEIFDVAVLPGQVRPGIVGLDRIERQTAITMPERSYWVVRRAEEEESAGSAPNEGTSL